MKKPFLCSLALMSFVKSQSEKDNLDKIVIVLCCSALKTVQLLANIPVCRFIVCRVNWLA